MDELFKQLLLKYTIAERVNLALSYSDICEDDEIVEVARVMKTRAGWSVTFDVVDHTNQSGMFESGMVEISQEELFVFLAIKSGLFEGEEK